MRRAIPTSLSWLLGTIIGALAPAPANAGDLSDGHTLFISAERMGGIERQSTTLGTRSTSVTNVFLFGNVAVTSPFDIPRLGIDYAVAPHVSLGGNAMLLHVSREQGNPDTTIYILGARLGGIVDLAPSVAFWGRGGLTYYTGSLDGGTLTTPVTTSSLGLNLEAMLIFKLIDHFGISASAIADIPLTGSEQVPNIGSQESKVTDYGVAMGLIGWL